MYSPCIGRYIAPPGRCICLMLSLRITHGANILFGPVCVWRRKEPFCSSFQLTVIDKIMNVDELSGFFSPRHRIKNYQMVKLSAAVSRPPTQKKYTYPIFFLKKNWGILCVFSLVHFSLQGHRAWSLPQRNFEMHNPIR